MFSAVPKLVQSLLGTLMFGDAWLCTVVNTSPRIFAQQLLEDQLLLQEQANNVVILRM